MKPLCAQQLLPLVRERGDLAIGIGVAKDHHGEITREDAMFQFTFDLGPGEQGQKTILARVRAGHLDGLPAVEVQDDVGALLFVEPSEADGGARSGNQQNGNQCDKLPPCTAPTGNERTT